MTLYKPQVRGGFSDRNGIKMINTEIQLNEFDQRTKNSIMNLLDYVFKMANSRSKSIVEMLYLNVYFNIFRVTKDDIPYYNVNDFEYVRKPIHKGITEEWDYDEILTFLEEFTKLVDEQHFLDTSLYYLWNDLFKAECVGYRFVEGKAITITNETEIATIEKALNSKYEACNKSIEKSIGFLYDREHPDYENSVKESISAIEGICNIINGTKKDSLGDALIKLEKSGVKIHSAMKNAFSALYGYTSDKNGIRHNAGIDENTTFEEAQYMLVTCSAFLNYLIELYEHRN